MLYELVIGRIVTFIKGIGKLGEALYKVFKGDFNGAWNTAKDAAMKITGVETVKKVVGQAKEMGQNAAEAYRKGYEEVERKKQKAGLTHKDTVAALAPTKATTSSAAQGIANTVTSAETSGSSGGSSRGGNITINIRSMVENMVLNGTLAENTDSIRRQVEEIMYRVLYAAQNIG